ncbi:hypothetical protein PO124_05740 [Bacillus licheniformis]|nr:hypothetical protein [Bacillus licheniformis]
MLLTIGLIMVYSASAVWATYKYDDSFSLRNGSFVCRHRGHRHVFIMNVDYWTWRTYAKY